MLKDTICLVTGATRGIGRAVAEQFAADDAIVIGTGTTDAGAESISAYLNLTSTRGEGVKLNVNDSNSIDELSRLIKEKYGLVTVLVNNAGISRNNLLVRIKESEWEEVIDTNLNSVYRLSKTFVRDMMKQRQGRIINISSVVGAVGNIGQAHYSATKAGVVAFSKSLALETASRNITVNVVSPGFIETDMTAELDENVVESLLAQVPCGRMGKPQDVAQAVAFLASPLNSYITGTTLYVDGGMVRR